MSTGINQTLKLMLQRLTEKVARANSIQHSGGKVVAEDWAELYQLENEARAILETASQPTAKPRVLILVKGGVADYVCDDGIDVEIFDRDNYEVDPEETGGVPRHYADLATPIDVPVNEGEEEVGLPANSEPAAIGASSISGKF
jgi:hypothetical protein